MTRCSTYVTVSQDGTKLSNVSLSPTLELRAARAGRKRVEVIKGAGTGVFFTKSILIFDFDFDRASQGIERKKRVGV